MFEISLKTQKNEMLSNGATKLERYEFSENGNHTMFEITKTEKGYKVVGQGAEFEDTSITRIRKVCSMLAAEYFISA